jgi:hypothetical protein
MPTPAETEVAATTGGGAQQTEPDHVSHVETQAEPPTTAADQSGPEGGSDPATAATTADNAPNEGGCCAGGACCGDDIVFTSDEEDDEPKVTVAAADTTAACESGCCGGGTETSGESVPTQATATTTADNSGGCTDGCCGDDIIFTSDEEDAAEEAVPSAGDGDPAVAATGGGGVAVSTSINVDDTNVDTATPDDTNQIKVIDNCGCGTCCEEVGEGDKHTGCGVGTSHAANADPASIAGSCCCGPPGARDEKSTTIRIQNMCCEQEAVLIRKLVAQQTGVTKVRRCLFARALLCPSVFLGGNGGGRRVVANSVHHSLVSPGVRVGDWTFGGDRSLPIPLLCLARGTGGCTQQGEAGGIDSRLGYSVSVPRSESAVLCTREYERCLPMCFTAWPFH